MHPRSTYVNKRQTHTIDHREKHKGGAMMDLLNKTGAGGSILEPERDLIMHPKNDYAPPFVTSLNFNFNMNDVFGSSKKTQANLLKSNILYVSNGHT